MPATEKLDRRVVFKRARITRDPAFNSEVIAWDAAFSAWASVADVPDIKRGGSEVVHADQRVQITRTRVVVRYRNDITSDMRVSLTDRVRELQIVGVAEIGRRVYLELTCEQFT